VFVAGAFELREGASKKLARPTAIFPRKREPEDMRDHAWAFGWTEDGSAFVHCIVISGAECDVCTFTGLTGATEKFQSGEECQADGGTLVTKDRLKARVAARKVAVRDGDWAHGGDLVVTLREVFGSADGKTRGALEVGTARRDGSAASTAHGPGPKARPDRHRDSGQSRPAGPVAVDRAPPASPRTGTCAAARSPGLGPILSRFCRDPGLSRDNSSNSGSYGPLRGHTHHITNIPTPERRNAS
jgi:hypothetical protein